MSNEITNNRLLIIDDDKKIWDAYNEVLQVKSTSSSNDQLLSLFTSEASPQSLSSKLTPFEYQLDFQSQGEAGYQAVQQALKINQPFAVAFIDVRMPPGWNGVKTAQLIRQIDPNIEIIIVTAYSDSTQNEIVATVGTPEKLLYMRKPFDIEELSQVALSSVSKWNISFQKQLQDESIQCLLKELQSTRNYLDNVINSMPSALLGVDELNIITQWNNVAEILFKRPRQEALGKPISSVCPQWVLNFTTIQQVMTESQVKIKEKCQVMTEQGLHYFNMIFYPLIDKHNHGVIIRIDDVTERTRMEELMIQSDKMVSVGGLAAGIAHEINTPLGSIIQNAQIIENRLQVNNKKNETTALETGVKMPRLFDYMEQRDIFDLLSGIRSSGERTSKIVKSMLGFCRQSTGMSQENVVEILKEAIELAKTDYDLKNNYNFNAIDIQLDYEFNLPSINCDKIKIEQVILNLIRNASHALNDDTKDDHQPKITLQLKQRNSFLQITVEDNGPGISNEAKTRLFEPFFTTKEVGVGTGLGLSLAYFVITEQHVGNMQVESTLGKGACFIIELPIEVSALQSNME